MCYNMFSGGLETTQAVFEIAKNIGIINKTFEWRSIGGKVSMDVAVVPVFGAHRIRVIGS